MQHRALDPFGPSPLSAFLNVAAHRDPQGRAKMHPQATTAPHFAAGTSPRRPPGGQWPARARLGAAQGPPPRRPQPQASISPSIFSTFPPTTTHSIKTSAPEHLPGIHDDYVSNSHPNSSKLEREGQPPAGNCPVPRGAGVAGVIFRNGGVRGLKAGPDAKFGPEGPSRLAAGARTPSF